ncbi:unnamed protein product [Toxocara canis]|uniref:Outer membrane efflux protein n=1 Tax=Toxocara canis TaxID=6265 RepID=A0A183U845_TOXCA|nr:unnamed protein product [Toxocara canis]
MRIASAELDKFAVDMQGSSKSAQFANIENLSAEEARHLLRAEMLRNEQSDVRIEMLTKRNVQLEKRLAVTDTAEKYYSLMKLDVRLIVGNRYFNKTLLFRNWRPHFLISLGFFDIAFSVPPVSG